MLIQDRRVHIAGSASSTTLPSSLKYAHDLIFELVKRLASMGARFTVGVGNEPLACPNTAPPLPLIFDWTILAAIRASIESGIAQVSGPGGRILATVATSKTDQQIPASRRDLWEFLLNAEAIELEFLKSNWSSGALRRQKLSQKSDILIIIGGGEGVEHLAEDEYMTHSKPVIPLDLKLGSRCDDGSGGAYRLWNEAVAQPTRFIQVEDPEIAGSLLTRASTRQGQRTIAEIVDAVARIIEALHPTSMNATEIGKISLPQYQQSVFSNVTAKTIVINGNIEQTIMGDGR